MVIIGDDPNIFLHEVYVVDFGDNYHRLDTEPSTELEKEVRKIRRRYKSFGQYMKAIAAYNEYMALLIQKHGGSDLFKIKMKYELIEDFVPPKPRMRNTRINKFILKNKLVLSNMKNANVLEKIDDFIEDVIDIPIDIDFTSERLTDKQAKEIIKEEGSTLSVRKIKQISSIDYLEEYFKTKNVMKNKKQDEIKISLKEIMSGKYFDKIRDTSDEDGIIFYKGNYLNRESADELQVFQNLNNSGWNSLKLMKNKNVSKRVTRVLKEKDKKTKKKKKKHKKDDDFIVKIITDNDYDTFKDFEEDMLDFTSGNIFRD